jgi:tRNA pseudouridine55 synthase
MQTTTYSDGAIILFNKPYLWTSFKAVSFVRRTTNVKKVGHAGTLDPLATGLLIICVGKCTKRINEFMGQQKEYTGTITLGSITESYDLEKEPHDFKSVDHLTEADILNATQQFIGPIAQLPPAHSAVKQDGKRLYELARAGKEVALKPRNIIINSFEITKIDLPTIDFKVVCGTGTYIRSLANDFGAALGVGGHLSSLCRTRIGDNLIEDAATEENLAMQLNGWTIPKI